MDNLGYYKVLIIEDNPGDLVLMRYYLNAGLQNIHVVNAISFKNAKEVLLKQSIDFHVIMMDLALPDKSGEELIAEILALCPNVPIIVLTGYEDMNFAARSLNMGISDYILKDELTSSLLHKSIAKALHQKQA